MPGKKETTTKKNTGKRRRARPSRKAPGKSRARKSTPRVTTAKLGDATTATSEQHYLMIQEAAYLKAEKDGFKGNPVDYWLSAEKDVATQLLK